MFDNTRCYGTPSYHVQAMFAANRPDVVLPVSLPGVNGTPQLFAVAGLKRPSGDLILKVVNRDSQPRSVNLRLAGLAGKFSRGVSTTLAGASLTDENTFDEPGKISPSIGKLPAFHPGDSYTFAPYSVTVLRWSKD